MSRPAASSFRRSLSGFLGASALGSAWVDRALQITRISRTNRSLSIDPVASVDATFTAQDGYEAHDPMAGFNAFTRQILAAGVLDSLIQLQSEMSAMDEDNVTVSAHVATDAYRHALDGLSAL